MSSWNGPSDDASPGLDATEAMVRLPTPVAPPARTNQFVVLLCVTTFASLSAFSFYVYPALLALRHVSESGIGLVMGAFYLGSFLGMVSMPGAFRTIGGRRALISSTSLFGLLSLLLLTDLPLSGIVVVRVLQGVAWGMILISTAVASLTLMGARRLAQAGAIYGACFLVGQALGPAVSELITRETGRVEAPLLLSAVAALLATLIVPLLRADAFAVVRIEAAPIKVNRIIQPLAATFLLSAGFGGATSFIVNYAESCSILPVSSFFLGSLVSGLALRLFASRFLDRYSRERVSAVAALLSLFGLAAIIHLHGPLQLWLSGALVGASAAIYSGSLQAMAVERSEDRVSAVTVFRGAVTLGVAFSSMTGGVVIDAAGYDTMFALLAGGSALAFLLMMRPLGVRAAVPR